VRDPGIQRSQVSSQTIGVRLHTRNARSDRRQSIILSLDIRLARCLGRIKTGQHSLQAGTHLVEIVAHVRAVIIGDRLGGALGRDFRGVGVPPQSVQAVL